MLTECESFINIREEVVMSLKKVTCVFACILPLAFSANADNGAGYNNFVTIKGGLDQSSRLGGVFSLGTADPTYTAGIAVGRKFSDIFGLELEYMHTGNRKYKTTSGWTDGAPVQSNTWEVITDTVMVNSSVDLVSEGQMTPYLKGGIGISRNKAGKNISINEGVTYTYGGKVKTDFAWQVGAGLNTTISPMFDLQVEYMFVNHGTVKTQSSYYKTPIAATYSSPAVTGKLWDHVASIGFKIKF